MTLKIIYQHTAKLNVAENFASKICNGGENNGDNKTENLLKIYRNIFSGSTHQTNVKLKISYNIDKK